MSAVGETADIEFHNLSFANPKQAESESVIALSVNVRSHRRNRRTVLGRSCALMTPCGYPIWDCLVRVVCEGAAGSTFCKPGHIEYYSQWQLE